MKKLWFYSAIVVALFCASLNAAQTARKAKPSRSADKSVVVTLVRWPYT